VSGVTTSFGALPAYSQVYGSSASAMHTDTDPSCKSTESPGTAFQILLLFYRGKADEALLQQQVHCWNLGI
jgi:hypothetical protein